MHTEGDEIHITDTEASGGSKEGVVRWVLIAGTLLAIILLSLIWIIPAMTQGDVEGEVSVSNKIQAVEEGDENIDSVIEAETFGDTPVGENADEDEAAADGVGTETVEN